MTVNIKIGGKIYNALDWSITDSGDQKVSISGCTLSGHVPIQSNDSYTITSDGHQGILALYQLNNKLSNYRDDRADLVTTGTLHNGYIQGGTTSIPWLDDTFSWCITFEFETDGTGEKRIIDFSDGSNAHPHVSIQGSVFKIYDGKNTSNYFTGSPINGRHRCTIRWNSATHWFVVWIDSKEGTKTIPLRTGNRRDLGDNNITLFRDTDDNII